MFFSQSIVYILEYVSVPVDDENVNKMSNWAQLI